MQKAHYVKILSCTALLFISKPCSSMLLNFDEIVSAVEPWVTKKDIAEQLMQESVDLQVPKKVIESNCLKAVFDAHESRVTLYEPFTCYCITYDFFLICIDISSADIKESDEISGNEKKKCCMQ